MYVSNIVTSLLNAHRVLKISNTKLDLNLWVIKPILASFAALSSSEIISGFVIIHNNILDIIFKVGIITFTYITILFLFGIIRKESLRMLRRNV